MSLKLTATSFLNGVKQSGLIELDRLEALLREFRQTGLDCSDSRTLAQAFVRREALTNWQAEKLLQGRHRGFLLGRYRLMSLLGAGEMSAVFLARHVMMDRPVAIKVLPGNKVHDTSYLGRFYREAKAVASLNHPNIVRAYDVDKQVDGQTELHYLVMEYVEGKNLEKMVQEKGRLNAVQAADVIRQAAAGLGHAHQAGLVHRDVKPQNLLIDPQGQVRILDLGLARFFKADSREESLTIKHDEKVLGTADFLAPEQAVDSHNVDARADIYGLGCTLYFALAGHPPFVEGTLVQRLLAHQTRKPTSMSVLRPETPADLVQILERMMAKKPADRFQTMGEVADALSRWLVLHADDSWKQANVESLARYTAVPGPRVAAAKAAVKSPSASAEQAISDVLGLVGELESEEAAEKAQPAPRQATSIPRRMPQKHRAPRLADLEERAEKPAHPSHPPGADSPLRRVDWPLVGLVAGSIVLLVGLALVILRQLWF